MESSASHQRGTRPRVCVVGAGVIGLTTATALQDTLPGCDVTIMADKFSPNTTSDGAGGFWEPHLLNNTPFDKIRRWGSATFEYLLSMITSPDAGFAGAKLLSGYCLSSQEQEEPEWRDQVLGYRDLTPAERRLFPRARWGRFFTSVQVDTQKLLPFLMKRFEERGGKVIRRSLNSLEELCGSYDVAVNCTGLGAKFLVNDQTLYPVRGQVAKVKAPWIKHFYIWTTERGRETYIYPGNDVVTVGGNYHKGDWRTAVDEEMSQSIWQRAVDFLPSLQEAEVANHWAGLRPTRPEVRLEREEVRSGSRILQVVHNYGHGGSGVTLSRGCALEASALVADALRQVAPSAKL